MTNSTTDRNLQRRSLAASVLALTIAAGLGGAMAGAAYPAAAQSTQTYSVPAGDLDSGLRRFAEQSRIQLIYPTPITAGQRTSGVEGSMSVSDAVGRLLAGTNLSYRFQDANTVIISEASSGGVEEDGSRLLGPVRVEGAQSTFAYSDGPVRGDGIAQLGGVRGGQDEEATGYRPNIATVGGLAPVAVEDIPRSVSVLTPEQIEKLDIQDIGDALRRLPGVAVIEESNPGLASGAAVISRGFQISRVQLDGGASRPLNLVGNGLLDLGPYERVELVRGPNGVFSGASSPGGSLNLVRKRPGDEESTEITAVLGSFNRRSVQVDYSTPSLAGSPFAFRGVASLSDQEFYYDKGARQNALLYGIVDAPLGAKARLEFGAQYSLVNDDAPYSGLYRYTGGELIQPGDFYANLTPSWTYDNSESVGVFSRLYIDLSDTIDVQVGLDLERGNQSRQRLNTSLNFVEGTGRSISSSASVYKESQDWGNTSFDVKITGKTELFGLDHAWFVAGELTETNALPSRNLYDVSGTSTRFDNLNQFLAFLDNPPPALANDSAILDEGGATTRAGIVIGDVVSWRDKIELTLSARRYFSDSSSFFVIDYQGVPYDLGFSEGGGGSSRAEAEWVPSWSLAFKPTRNLTFYGTQAEGREEVLEPRYTASGEIVGPSNYSNLEGGVKFATDRWLATLAYYHMVNENVAQRLNGTSCLPANTQNTPCYDSEGATTESKGVDFEIGGELLPGLNISGSYTWANVESTGINVSSQTPVQAGQIVVDWSPASMPRSSLRAALRYRGEVYQSGTRRIYDPDTGAFIEEVEFDFKEDPYFVLDLGYRHQVTDNVSLDVFVENITDEQYLSTVSASERNFPGAPRSIVATLRWKPTDRDFPRSTTGMAPFGDPASWYTAVETGVYFADDLSPEAEGLSQDGTTPVNWTFETDYRAIGLVRLGYRVSQNWRAELEGSFRNAVFGDIGGGTAAPFGVCGAAFSDYGRAFDCDDADGDMSSWTGMLNGLYDFGGDGARLRPFVGAGVGVSRNSVDFAGKMEGIGQDAPWRYDSRRHLEEGIGGDTSRTAFTYQLLAGLSYQLTSQATLEATYRYYAVPGLSWGSYNLDGVGGFPAFGDPWPALTPRIGDFEEEFASHSLTIGVRWAFGVR